MPGLRTLAHNKKTMEISNYGELLAKGLDLELLEYQTYGSYQGDYIAVLKGADNIYLFKGSYGSCSGCDWLESNSKWTDGGLEIEEGDVKTYCSGEKPFLTIPKDKIETVLAMEDISQLFPANTRNSYDDWDWEDIKKLLKSIKENQ